MTALTLNPARRSLRATIFMPAVLVAGLFTGAVAPPAQARPAAPGPAGAAERSVAGRPLPARPGAPDPEAGKPATRPAPVWPRAGETTVDLGSARAAAVPGAAVSIAAAGAPVRHVQVRVLDQKTVGKVGGIGVAVQVARTDGGTRPQPVTMTFDYAGFRYAGGGDLAGRLRLVRLPGCALTRPAEPRCAGSPVPARNDPAAARIIAQVPATAHAPDADVYTLAAAASSDSGDYRATDLRPSGKWAGADGSGDFTYSYPIPVPPSPYGEAPDLALSYSSQSVDGRTSASNNQASWVGLGWDLNPGFVEREYRACAKDGTDTLSDLCWYSPYAKDEEGAAYVISLNGTSTELIRDSAGRWHAKDDPGWKIEHTYDGDNSDNSNEAWVVSTPDGNRYIFGYHQDSNWTVPVVGNDSGEPCHSTAPTPCRQTYRWNLDEVRGHNEDVTRYTWTKETNNYKRFSNGASESYDRGGYLSRIEYGMQAGERPADRIDFDTGYRCVSDVDKATVNCAAPTSSSDDSTYPDVPTDKICAAGQSCSEQEPTFFVTRRLTAIRTQVWDPTTASYLQVNRVQPTFAFPIRADRPTRCCGSTTSRSSAAGGRTSPCPRSTSTATG
jgi:hypothetical protein